jgi:hypothetical protein
LFAQKHIGSIARAIYVIETPKKGNLRPLRGVTANTIVRGTPAPFFQFLNALPRRIAKESLHQSGSRLTPNDTGKPFAKSARSATRDILQRREDFLEVSPKAYDGSRVFGVGSELDSGSSEAVGI